MEPINAPPAPSTAKTAEGKPKELPTCHKCEAIVLGTFCGECGTKKRDSNIDKAWGPGSKATKTLTIPKHYTFSGEQEIEVVIDGTKYQGDMELTFDTYENVCVLISRRLMQDRWSRFGEPGAKRVVEYNLGAVSGKNARS